MTQNTFDAIVIGGGPGGSTAATYLARAGKKVLLLEKEHFPRFHIGESLLPYNRRLFDEMGVLPALEAAGFPTKLGAQFHLGNASKRLKLVFSNGRFTRETAAFQVERATFDHILLKHAQSSGADVRQGCTVSSFQVHPDQVTVSTRSDSGDTATFHGRFLIDATGRANLTGNQEKVRVMHPRLKKLAVFSHFENVRLDQGSPRGDTVIVRLENKWFWLIPISTTKTSVGCVMDQAEFAAAGKSPEQILTDLWMSSTEMRDRMAAARATDPVQVTTDFSYHNTRLAGPRLLRVGDAAGFMDPIFSAGVFLAMYSAKLASKVVLDSLAAGHNAAPLIGTYEKEVFRAMRFYWEMVEGFYTTPFMELFLEPRPKFSLPDAITAILAGELGGGWAMNWRKCLFFWLIKLQARFPLVPRLSFAEPQPDTPSPTPPQASSQTANRG